MKQVKVPQFISACRFRGHQHVSLDSLGPRQQDKVTDLDPSFHSLTGADFQETFNVGSFTSGKETTKLGGLLEALKQAYYGPTGTEYMYITSTEEKRQIQQRIESGRATLNSEEKKYFLSELTTVEDLERYLGAKFPGVEHFSLGSGDALVSMLREMIHYAGNSGTRGVVLGMVRCGRLNVPVNMLGRESQDLFDEFAGRHKKHLDMGDVKYHTGFSFDSRADGGLVHLVLASSSSHLEIVSPVIIDSVHARLDRLGEPNSNKVLPITAYGDATMAGQGVVQEVLNMSKVRGHEVGGTVRIVINSQIGLTTSNPPDAHSAPYCADIGKMVQAPIFRVSAGDPEVVTFVTRLVLDFHNTFKRDIFIGLICHRRHGHNEADEPSATQPLMCRKIKKHPTSRKIYADKLKQKKVATLEDAIEMVNLYCDMPDAGDCVVAEWCPMSMYSFVWSPHLNHEWDEEYPNRIEIKRLQELAERTSMVPEAAEMQSRVTRIYGDRQAMAAGEKLFNQGDVGNLVYATLADEDIPVHPLDEDFGRGILFHRHAVIHNQSNGPTYMSLQHIHDGQGVFRIWDSVLSEEAILAFEYDYATAGPRTLTIWEVQSGDFANGAQVVTDQFISSGEQRWGRMCSLVMLLPHDYGGQGLEHFSARPERYLQLYAEQSMQVCVPSTSARAYHILCRQALCGICYPPVVMSPKSLLRRLLAVSSLEELANDTFLSAIGEIGEFDPKGVRRIVMYSGKIYYDLLEQCRKNNQHDVVIMRIKQLYPFPHKTTQEVLQQFTHVKDSVWCQEEPLNQST